MIDDSKITEAVNAYIGYPKEVDEGVEVSMQRDAFKAGVDWFRNALWHPASEVPEKSKTLLLQYAKGYYLNIIDYVKDKYDGAEPWQQTVDKFNILKWCYIDDLFKKESDKK